MEQTDQNAILSHVDTTEVGQVVPSHNCHIQSNIHPLHLHQTVKYSKLINTFYCKMASLQMKRCSTCVEKFPTLIVTTVQDGITECKRCRQDKSIPEQFSSENNMNPGKVPQKLQVYRYTIHFHH